MAVTVPSTSNLEAGVALPIPTFPSSATKTPSSSPSLDNQFPISLTFSVAVWFPRLSPLLLSTYCFVAASPAAIGSDKLIIL